MNRHQWRDCHQLRHCVAINCFTTLKVLAGSAEDWRMRARGAKVTIFGSYDKVWSLLWAE
jgi:hypothetical protein